MAQQLKVVAGTTEDDFLAIGGRLQDFYQRGTGISELASEMMGEVAGEHVSGFAIGEPAALFRDADRHDVILLLVDCLQDRGRREPRDFVFAGTSAE